MSNLAIYIFCTIIVVGSIFGMNYTANSIQEEVVQKMGIAGCFNQLPKYLSVEHRIKICQHNREKQ